MPAKTPFAMRATERLLARLDHQGNDVAIKYAVSVASQHPLDHRLLQAMREALAPELRALLDTRLQALHVRRQVRRGKEDQAARFAREQADERERQIRKSLSARLEQARRVGQAAVVVATLTTDERRLAGASKAEITQAIALRRDAIRSTRVKEILGCTETELRRWSEDGRLPVLFRRRMPVSGAGKTLDVRHWSLALVAQAVSSMAAWRDEDIAASRLQRKRPAQ